MQSQGILGALRRGVTITIPIDGEQVLFTFQIFDQMLWTGTLYFKNKEDFFLALFEERSARRARELSERMKTTKGKSENLQSLRELYSSQANDRPWALLSALMPILSGLVLESEFEPDLLSNARLALILQRVFDALIVSELK